LRTKDVFSQVDNAMWLEYPKFVLLNLAWPTNTAEHPLHLIRSAQGRSGLVSFGGGVWLAVWLCFRRSQVSFVFGGLE